MRPGDSAKSPLGRRSAGKIVRDLLLVIVILAMALPFLVARVGEVPLTPQQTEHARLARLAAYEQQDWLANSMANKVVSVAPVAGGVRMSQRYYTFFGLPWGWSEAVVGDDGDVSDLSTGLTLGSFF